MVLIMYDGLCLNAVMKQDMQLEALFLLSSTKPLFPLRVHQSCFEYIHACI